MEITVKKVNAYSNGPCSLCKWKEPRKRDTVFQLLFHCNPRQSQGVNICRNHLVQLDDAIVAIINPTSKTRGIKAKKKPHIPTQHEGGTREF